MKDCEDCRWYAKSKRISNNCVLSSDMNRDCRSSEIKEHWEKKMIGYCKLKKQDVLSEADCYYCDDFKIRYDAKLERGCRYFKMY